MNQQQSTLHKKADRAIREQSLVSKGQTVIVAVSGGIDSVVLLDYLATRNDLELTLVIAHLNHSLRGAESDGDEQFVRMLAARYACSFECRCEDVASFARGAGLSLEEAGRELRYRFFADVAQQSGADSVAIAHHLDDQAETVLMRLIRGSGPAGLRGMSHRSADGLCIRPLLDVSREEIDEYAGLRNLDFRIDSSNSDASFLRNRIRHQLIPCLKEYNPAIAVRLAETASIMAADEAILSGIVAKRWQELGCKSDSRVVLDGTGASAEVTGLRFRLYRRSLELLKGDLRRISYRHLQAIDRLLLEGPPNGTLDLPDGTTVMRSYGKIVFSHKTDSVEDNGTEITIENVGDFDLPWGGKVLVRYCDNQANARESGKGVMIADIGEFPFPWTVRTFHPGDRIVPRGMKGRRKVKELFIDEKIPRFLRQKIPLFFSNGTLFWVAGLRRGGSFPLSPEARAVRVELLEFMQNVAMLA